MKLEVDTHTHTYASGHAYSTLMENGQAAKTNGVKMFCTTDHSESMPGAPHHWFFGNQKILPRFLSGVAVIRGVESNVMNIEGEIDIPLNIDNSLDWIIASLHEPVFGPADKAAHTQALINVIKGGRIDALGHLGNPNFDFDFHAVIACAKEYNVAIEINNTSLKGSTRIGSPDRCNEIASIARDLGAYITTGSDAHFCQDIGKFELVSDLLDKIGMPSEQVITHSTKQFLAFLQLRGRPFISEYKDLY
ncbi:MAG: putative hydrolase [Psychromonas sp.]|jgi:putative hydrolase|uniref:phosphatase n=1 Tax=Psychromonas sp. TaxID=1884585 RepID=UPI0039E4BDC5